MNSQDIINFAPVATDWQAIIPEISLLFFAAVMLFLRFRPAVFASAFSMIAIGLVYFFSSSAAPAFSGTVFAEPSFGFFILACVIFTTLMTPAYFAKNPEVGRNEFFCLLFICAAGLMLFVRSRNLMLSFVSLECATICMYILAGWGRKLPSSLEAGVKFLIVSGISGALFLMGIALIYGAGLSMGADLLDFANISQGVQSPLFVAGLALVFAALLFKVGGFPFQFWMPDVYQGAPTPVSAFFAVGSKAAGLIVAANIIVALGEPSQKFLTAISVIAGLTIIVGNFAALTQSTVKRLMALSGVANAGYLLTLLAALAYFATNPDMLGYCSFALYFYLTAYLFATYGVFYVINLFTAEDDSRQNVLDYCGLSKISPLATSCLAINLSSLAGVPPTAGFFGKLLIILCAWFAGFYWLVGVLVLGSAASVYYYFVWMRTAYAEKKGGETSFMPVGFTYPTLAALTAATLIFGVFILGGI